MHEDNGCCKAMPELWKDNDWKWHELRLSQSDIRNIGKDFSLSEAKCPELREGRAVEWQSTLPKGASAGVRVGGGTILFG